MLYCMIKKKIIFIIRKIFAIHAELQFVKTKHTEILFCFFYAVNILFFYIPNSEYK